MLIIDSCKMLKKKHKYCNLLSMLMGQMVAMLTPVNGCQQTSRDGGAVGWAITIQMDITPNHLTQYSARLSQSSSTYFFVRPSLNIVHQ
jgi:hypothetical protein